MTSIQTQLTEYRLKMNKKYLEHRIGQSHLVQTAVVHDDTVDSSDEESDYYDESSSDDETESDTRHYDNYYNNECEVSDTESED
jgi:hypothetical protein